MKFKHGVIYNGKLYRAGANVPMPEKNTTETIDSSDNSEEKNVVSAEKSNNSVAETTEKPKRKYTKHKKAVEEAESGVVNDG